MHKKLFTYFLQASIKKPRKRVTPTSHVSVMQFTCDGHNCCGGTLSACTALWALLRYQGSPYG